MRTIINQSAAQIRARQILKKSSQQQSKDTALQSKPHVSHKNTTFVLTASELDRIRDEALGKKPNAKNERSAVEANDKLQKISKVRPKIEFEELNDLEIERQEQRQEILRRAQLHSDEQLDEIKRMNELILHTQCMIVRENQMVEKQKIATDLIQSEQSLDAAMEQDRIRDLEFRAQRDAQVKQERKAGALVVLQQIQEHQLLHVLEVEKKEREAEADIQVWAAQNAREVELAAAKKVKQNLYLKSVQAAKEENVHRRQALRQRERDEDEHIVKYLVERAQVEQELENEEMRKKNEREMELARVRALQQRLHDTRAEQDALHAKRATEQYERDWRRKEKEALGKKKAQQAGLLDANKKQQQDREHTIAVEALKGRMEFEETLRVQNAAEEKLKQEKAIKDKKIGEFVAEIKRQVADRDLQRKQRRDKLTAESEEMKQEIIASKVRLEQVKQRKMNELQALGIPEKYRAQIQRQMQHLATSRISAHPTQPRSGKPQNATAEA